MEESKRNKILLWVGGILGVLCAIAIILFGYEEKKVRVFCEEYELAKTDEFMYYIDKCGVEDISYNTECLIVQGWIYKIDDEVKEYDVRVLLMDKSQDIYYELPTMYVLRPDVKSEEHSGFYCSASIKDIPKKINEYDLYIYYNCNDNCNLVFIGELCNETNE